MRLQLNKIFIDRLTEYIVNIQTLSVITIIIMFLINNNYHQNSQVNEKKA